MLMFIFLVVNDSTMQSCSNVHSSTTKPSHTPLPPTAPPPSSPLPPPHSLPPSPPLQRRKLMCKPSSSIVIETCASSSSRQVHQHTLAPSLQQYVEHLQYSYIFEDNPAYDKEHDLLQTKAGSFIKNDLVYKNIPKYMSDKVKRELMKKKQLGQIEAIGNLKRPLPICDACVYTDNSGTRYAARSVLVEGGPGIGKTTFAFELCKRWAKREALQDWTVVIFLKLRDQKIREAKTLRSFLYHRVPEVRETDDVVKELVYQEGEGMLLILDGYDELTENQRDFGPILQQLMSRKLLRKATLMVTSRPHATRTLDDNFRRSIDQQIELLGFTGKSIGNYIKSACGDNSDLIKDFKSYLDFHPFSSLMFNPLLCAIVTELYCSHWESGDKDFSPKTLTQLYTGLVQILLERYLSAHWPNENWRVRDLNDIPQVNKQFIDVTKLAAEGIKQQQYVFDEGEWKIPSETLSLMQKEDKFTFYFLHRLLQEFLAAVHYSRCPEQLPQLFSQSGQFPLCSLLKKSEDAHWPVVQFLAGRTKFEGISSTFLIAIGLHDDEDDDEVTEADMSLLHLLYETQCPQRIQSTLVTDRKYLSATGRSPLDWYVIGYCIANSASTWRLNKKARDEPNNFDHLVTSLGLAHPESSGKGKIHCLHISGDWYENCKILLKLQPNYTKTIIKLELVHVDDDDRNSKTDEKGSKHVSIPACSCPELQELKIINARSDFSSFLNIFSKSIYLHTILLNNCTVSSEVTTSLINCLQSLNCIVCKLVLHLLHFFGHPDCDRLTTAVVKSTTIKKLLFTNLKVSSLKELASGLKQNGTMEEIAVGSTLADFKDHLPNLITAVNSCSAVKKLWLSKSYREWFGNSELSDSDAKIVWFDKDKLFKYWGLREMRSVVLLLLLLYFCAHFTLFFYNTGLGIHTLLPVPLPKPSA